MWLVVLSDQLTIVALVGHYPTNKLIVRRPLIRRLPALPLRVHAVLAPVSQGYPPPNDTFLRVPHPSATADLRRPCDLHVLSMPPAFALSQDQTLRFIRFRRFRLDHQSRTQLINTNYLSVRPPFPPTIPVFPHEQQQEPGQPDLLNSPLRFTV